MDKSFQVAIHEMVRTSIFLAIAGAITTGIYFLGRQVYTQLRRWLMSTVTIHDSDPVYEWVMKWISEVKLEESQLRQLEVRTERVSIRRKKSIQKQRTERPSLLYFPDSGVHTTYHKGKKVYVWQRTGQTVAVGIDRQAKKLETLTLGCYGNTTSLLKEIVEEAVDAYMNQDRELTNIYQIHERGGWWVRCLSKDPRPKSSLVMDKDLMPELIADVRQFLCDSDWYNDRGVPYRRGYLLHGPPGNGKTSFVQVLAASLGLKICLLNLSGNNLDDSRLNARLHDTPSHSIILIEDIDAIFVDRESAKRESGSSVTFSGLLNALDGVASQEGRIVFMTTNHREKLDPALIRPGRCDVQVKFTNATTGMLRSMFLKFFPEEEDYADDFAALIPNEKLSMAKVQGHLMNYKDDAKKALGNANTLISGEASEMSWVSITYWLNRLALAEAVPEFLKEKILTMNQLKDFSASDLKQYGIAKKGDQQRVMGMLASREISKRMYAIPKKDKIPKLIKTVLRPNKVHLFDEIVRRITTAKNLSGYQIVDIVTQFGRDYADEVLLKAIETQSGLNELIERGGVVRLFPEESEDSQDIQGEDQDKDYLGRSLNELLEEWKVSETFRDKLESEEIGSVGLLLELEEKQIEKFGLTLGELKKVTKAIKAIKKGAEKHRKQKEEEEQETKFLKYYVELKD